MTGTIDNLTDDQRRTLGAVADFSKGKPRRVNAPTENPKRRPRTAARLARMVQRLAADLRAGADREIIAQQLDGLGVFFTGLCEAAGDGMRGVA